jgi:hypothetical protein
LPRLFANRSRTPNIRGSSWISDHGESSSERELRVCPCRLPDLQVEDVGYVALRTSGSTPQTTPSPSPALSSSRICGRPEQPTARNSATKVRSRKFHAPPRPKILRQRHAGVADHSRDPPTEVACPRFWAANEPICPHGSISRLPALPTATDDKVNLTTRSPRGGLRPEHDSFGASAHTPNSRSPTCGERGALARQRSQRDARREDGRGIDRQSGR